LKFFRHEEYESIYSQRLFSRWHDMSWIRRHPVRVAVYLLLAAGGLTAFVLARGVIAGREDALLTRVARWEPLRGWVARQGIAGYAVEAVHVGPGGAGCGLCVEITGGTLSLVDPGAARLRAESAQLCSALTASARGFQVGAGSDPRMVWGASAAASAAGARVDELHLGADLLVAGEVAATLRPIGAKLARVRILPGGDGALAEVREASAGPVALSGNVLRIEKAQAAGVQALVEQGADGNWNALSAAVQFGAAGQKLLAMADATLAEAARVLSRVRALLLWAVVLACAGIFVLKLLLSRRPQGIVLRVASAALPVALCLALYGLFGGGTNVASFAIWSLAAVATMGAVLEIVWYRHAEEWHQRIEPLVFDLLAPLWILPPLVAQGYPLALPRSVPRPTEVQITSGEARDITARAKVMLCERRVETLTRVWEASTQQARVTLDPGTLGIRGVDVQRAQARGETGSVALADLDRLAYLPPSWRRTPAVAFCVNATLGAGRKIPEECDSGERAVRLSAGAAVDPGQRSAKLTATVRAPQAALRVRGSGDLTGATIEELRTLPGSRFGIGDASGRISWAQAIESQIRLARLAGDAAQWNVAAGIVELGLSAPRSCAAGKVELQAQAGDLSLSGRGFDLRAAETKTSLLRAADGGLTSETGLRGIRVMARRDGEAMPWLVADAGSVDVGLRGRLSPGWIPRGFDGEATLAVFRKSREPAVRFSAPFRVAADFWRGEVSLPSQVVTLEQKVSARFPVIPMRISMNGRLESLGSPARARAETRVEIPKLDISQAPIEAELKELEARAVIQTPGPPARITYSSGWSRVTLPKAPGAIQLDEVAKLDAASEGSAEKLPSWEAFSADLRSLGKWARQTTPRVPAELLFRFAGESPAAAGAPALTLETKPGVAIRVDRLGGAIRTLSLPDLQLAKAEVDSNATGIRTSQGAGDLEFAARSTVSDEAIDLKISEPLGATLRSQPERVEFALHRELDLGPLLGRLDPFLRAANIDLEGITLGGRVGRLRTTANFGQAELKGFTLETTVEPGRWASLDIARMLHAEPRFLRALEVSGKAPLTLRITAPAGVFPRVELATDAPAVELSVNGGAQHTSLSAVGLGRLTLLQKGPGEPRPVLDQASRAASGFRRQLSNALDVFAPNAPAVERVRWRADVGGATRPVLAMRQDGLEIALRSRVSRLEWQRGGRASNATANVGLAAYLGLRDGHLIADLVAPVEATLALSGQAPSRWNFRAPVLLVMDEHLEPAPAGSAELWNSGYYERLWDGYSPRHATAPFAWIDRKELAVGGISLEQVTFPASPFRMAVGYGGPLEVHAPVSARLLFGRVEALSQARLTWAGRAVSVDSRTRATLRGLQAGAVGIGAGRAPFLDDMLEGQVDVRAEGLLVDSKFLPQLLTNPAEVAELDKISMSLDFHSTGPRPGVMQFETQANLRLSNALLNAIGGQIQMHTPMQALRYRDLAFRFQVTRGEVQTAPLLVDLKGVEFPNVTPVQIDSVIRVHWGRERAGFGGTAPRLRGLLSFLQRTLGAPARN
jgi:hypothetical protein